MWRHFGKGLLTHHHSFQWNKGIIRWKSMCTRHEKKLIDMKRFNMKRFVKKKTEKTQPRLSHFPIVWLKFERESGRDFHWSFVNSYLHLSTWLLLFTTLSYFHYGDITVPRHCGKCFYDFFDITTGLVSSFFFFFRKHWARMKFVNWGRKILFQIDFEVNKVMFFCFVGLVRIQPGIFSHGRKKICCFPL